MLGRIHTHFDRLASDFDVKKDTGQSEGIKRRMVTVEGDEASIKAKSLEWGSDVISEAEMVRYTTMAFRPTALASSSKAGTTGSGTLFWVVVRCNGVPVAQAEVSLSFVSRTGSGAVSSAKAVTDTAGRASLPYDAMQWWPAQLAVTPKNSCWDFVGAWPVSGQVIQLPALAKEGALGWWHRLLGITEYQESRGAGIRIGVADTGVGPHPYLSHITDAGACVGGGVDPFGGQDVENHGTHVCGIVGARPAAGSNEYAGIAPGAEIVCVRVFSEPGSSPNQQPSTTNGDLANGVDLLVENHQVDLINLSLGGESPSLIEQDALQAALEAGTLVIAAAGNTAGPVIYPAAYQQSVAISAVGIPNTAPPQSMDGQSMPNPQVAPDRFSGPVFLATFSNFGPSVRATGPGVGIVSTVPATNGGAPYMAMSGTSMASPMVCASLAALLSEDSVYAQTPRGAQRAVRAWQVLTQNLRSLPGLSPVYVGGGLATAVI